MDITIPEALSGRLKTVPNYQNSVISAIERICVAHEIVKQKRASRSPKVHELIAKADEVLQERDRDGYTTEQAKEDFLKTHAKISASLKGQ